MASVARALGPNYLEAYPFAFPYFLYSPSKGQKRLVYSKVIAIWAELLTLACPMVINRATTVGLRVRFALECLFHGTKRTGLQARYPHLGGYKTDR